jgi:hypothetical protein
LPGRGRRRAGCGGLLCEVVLLRGGLGGRHCRRRDLLGRGVGGLGSCAWWWTLVRGGASWGGRRKDGGVRPPPSAESVLVSEIFRGPCGLIDLRLKVQTRVGQQAQSQRPNKQRIRRKFISGCASLCPSSARFSRHDRRGRRLPLSGPDRSERCSRPAY